MRGPGSPQLHDDQDVSARTAEARLHRSEAHGASAPGPRGSSDLREVGFEAQALAPADLRSPDVSPSMGTLCRGRERGSLREGLEWMDPRGMGQKEVGPGVSASLL